MRKINAHSLPFKAIGLCFVALLLFITSCKKDNVNGKLSNDELQALKTWQSQNFDQKSILFADMVLNWNTIYVNQLNDKTVYEVDLNTTDNAFITNSFLKKGDKKDYQSTSRFKLLIFKDTQTGKITDGYYMSSISNAPVHYKQVNNFTGYIYFYNKQGNFVNGWVYDAGKALQGISQGTEAGYRETMNAGLKEKINLNNFGDGRIQVASQEFCYTIEIPIYGTSCIAASGESGPAGPPVCVTIIKGYTYGRYCTPNQMAVDDNGGVVPDPNNPKGTEPKKPTLPSIGPDEEPADIKNKVNDPCLKAMVQKELDRGINFSAEETLNSIFGENSDINLDFGDKIYANTGTDGGALITKAVRNPNGSVAKMDITITLNSGILPNASQEYITATILHESLHAYFDYKNGVGDENGQHIIMASQPYISKFSAAMQKIYPNMSGEDALALAWGGLEGTPDYDTYKLAEPYKVGQMYLANSEYRDGSKGSKCPTKQ
ncbi:hypothetical protein [Pedobacter nototheniae]|uniref:hypothetical protein n=1 Tax=Pedobacter nototheniae TaxID=2488994 RepID=UPI002930D378|nr:hypothetical protein [Pedobacter nototheniae]